MAKQLFNRNISIHAAGNEQGWIKSRTMRTSDAELMSEDESVPWWWRLHKQTAVRSDAVLTIYATRAQAGPKGTVVAVVEAEVAGEVAEEEEEEESAAWTQSSG